MNLFIAHNSFIFVASVSVGMSLYSTSLCNWLVQSTFCIGKYCYKARMYSGHLGTNQMCPVVWHMPTCAGGGGKGRPSSLGKMCHGCQSDLIFQVKLYSLGPLLSV